MTNVDAVGGVVRPNPMQDSWTEAAKVRRRFKAGRPMQMQNNLLSHLAAIGRTCIELDKLRGLQRDAHLDPDDVKAALIFCTPETEGQEDCVQYHWLPTPDKIPSFTKKILKIKKPIFLGVLFYQHDPAADEGKQHVAWVLQFMGGPLCEKKQLAAKNHFVRGGHKALDS